MHIVQVYTGFPAGLGVLREYTQFEGENIIWLYLGSAKNLNWNSLPEVSECLS